MLKYINIIRITKLEKLVDRVKQWYTTGVFELKVASSKKLIFIYIIRNILDTIINSSQMIYFKAL